MSAFIHLSPLKGFLPVNELREQYSYQQGHEPIASLMDKKLGGQCFKEGWLRRIPHPDFPRRKRKGENPEDSWPSELRLNTDSSLSFAEKPNWSRRCRNFCLFIFFFRKLYKNPLLVCFLLAVFFVVDSTSSWHSNQW